MRHGVVVVDKPAGLTSHDVIARLRRVMGIPKMGHTGTLDPDATGVLVVCVGQATKIIPYLEEADKGYEAVVAFGSATSTLDAAGEVLQKEVVTEGFEFDDALTALAAVTELHPPQVSAIKVAGKKLYEYARKGQVVDVPMRPMRAYEVRPMGAMTLADEHAYLPLYLRVSRGSYVRSMVAFLGDRVGVPAHLSSLRRTHSGVFSLAHAVPLDQVTPLTPLLSIEKALGFPVLDATPEIAQLVHHGKPIANPRFTEKYVTIMKDVALAIYENQGEWLMPSRGFVYDNSRH